MTAKKKIKDLSQVADPLHPDDSMTVIQLRKALAMGVQGLGLERLLEIVTELCNEEAKIQLDIWDDKSKAGYWRIAGKIINETRRSIRGIK